MQEAGSSSTNSLLRNDPQYPVSHISSVTTSCPAKKITFFRSGDAQFSGVRMAIHTRSFRCFDALLDDLSQKVPLPFGVRTITTPRGTHPIQHLEQLKDGGCYICSDRHCIKPVDVEVARRHPTVWLKSNPPSSCKKPTRPEEPPPARSGLHYHRHPKKIVLVKNTDPAMRRSITLSKTMAPSLHGFMAEVSEVMQYQVRKLYTLEGRKIDSMQSLMRCPSVLLCVGQEPFKALLPENLRMHTDENLTGTSTRCRSSNCTEGHKSKNKGTVNFGLETKKSIIHPRSDSGNKSMRFSLSSGKSYQNGLCVTPGQSAYVSTCPNTKEAIQNEDIEKRVLVNKDGSLSVEMKVRFRLANKETLHWSTEIKKSAATLNKISSVKEEDPHYIQDKPEYSDLESSSAYEVEEGEEEFTPKCHHLPKHLDEFNCQNCSNHCQKYDIWKNPMDNEGGKSPSSSDSTCKIMHKMALVDNVHTLSISSEECTDHVAEKACFQQTAEERARWVQYCAVRRCCSQNEVSTAASKLKFQRINENTYENDTAYRCHCDVDRKPNTTDFHDSFCDPENFEITNVTKYHPNSAISNSSKVFEEGQCDDASRACAWSQSEKLAQCMHSKIGQASENVCLSPRPPSNASSCYAHSSKHKMYRNVHPLPEMPHQWRNHADTYRTDSARCTVSKVSSRFQSCHCRVKSSRSMASGTHIGFGESKVCNDSRARTNCPRAAAVDVFATEEVQAGETEGGSRCMSIMSANMDVFSGQCRKGFVCTCCSGCKNADADESKLSEHAQHTQAHEVEDFEVKSLFVKSPESHGSDGFSKHTHCVPQTASPVPDVPENGMRNHVAQSASKQGHSESVPFVLSEQCNNSNQSTSGRSSEAKYMCSENVGVANVEESPRSAMSVKSDTSAKSNTNCIVAEGVPTSGKEIQNADEVSQKERAISPLSDKSNGSARSSCRSHCSNSEGNNLVDLGKTSTKLMTSHDCELKRADSPVLSANNTHGANMFQKLRMDSAISTNSTKSSFKSAKSQKAMIPSPTAQDKTCNQIAGVTTQERASSTLSDSSRTSRPSNTLSKNVNKIQKNVTQIELSEMEKFAPQYSETVSKTRVLKTPCPERSYRSYKLNSNIHDTVSTLPPTRSSKCHCSSYKTLMETNSKNHNGCVQTMANVPSESRSVESLTLCLHGQSGEPLSTTSTASVSFGLCEDNRCEDLTEGSFSSMSQKSEEEKSLSQILIPKPAASDDAPNSSEKAKTASCMSSALSENSQQSPVLQDHCKSPKQTFSVTSATKSGSVLSTESKAQNTAGSQLNDSRHAMPSGWSGLSDVSCNKSSCRASKISENNSFIKNSKCATQVIDGSKNGDKGEIDKATAILERFSKCSQNKMSSGKDTTTGMAKSKDHCATKIKKSSFSYLEINGTKRKSDHNIDASSIQSLKISKADKRVYKKGGQTSRTGAVIVSDLSPNSKVANRNMMPAILLGSASDRVLCHSPFAADLLGEKTGNSIPDSRGSYRSNRSGKKRTFEKGRNGHKCQKSSRYKKRGKSLSSQKKCRDQDLELMPSNLPNASPVEVVNDWLRKIPVEDHMFQLGDKFNVQHNEAVPVNAEESLQNRIGGMSKDAMKMKEFQDIGWPAGRVTVRQDISVIHNETLTCHETSQTAAVSSSAPEKLTKRQTLPKRCQSSVQVMKVLISPKLDRCNSLPEVSPTYGKKLITSAKELLDCLINHDLIDSKNDKDDKYNEILSIIHSLWISEPSENEQDKPTIQDTGSAEDEFNPRSSSGIDVSSGSLGSGRVSVYGGVQKSDTSQGRITPIAEQEPPLQIHEISDKEGECDSATPKHTNGSHTSSQPITPDIAERVRCSPEEEKMDREHQEDEGLHVKEVIQSKNKKEINKITTRFYNKCCRNYSSTLNSVNKDRDQPGNSNSGTSPCIHRGTFTKRVSQDPDPVWVLSLLKKLEKQFMSHHANAVEEFKVKWDLNDNEMLNTMVRELKEEVHKRIQSSINRELQKIQSRAGRTPKPLISSLSRDFTVETDQRRKHLKVMRNKSINPSLLRNEDLNYVSGTEFSDQQSEDEYCPCDTCMKKKTASRVAQRTESHRLAPVVTDFDLRKILQTKKDPPPPVSRPTESIQEDPEKEAVNCFKVQEKNLEVVDEEAEVYHELRMQSDDLGNAKAEMKAATAAVQTKDENSAQEAAGASEKQITDVEINNDREEEVEEELPDDDGKGTGEKHSAAAEEEGREEEGEPETGRARAEEGKAKEDSGTNNQGKGSQNKEAASDTDEAAVEEARQAESAMQGGGETTKDLLDKEAGIVVGEEQGNEREIAIEMDETR